MAKAGIPVYGVGIQPTKYLARGVDGKDTKEYSLWKNMIKRAYSTHYKSTKPTYGEVSVCEEWLQADNFLDWCQDQVGFGCEDFQLDKDILAKGNKIYCPDLCVFVPRKINMQLCKSDAIRGEYPVGVCLVKRSGRFKAEYHLNGKGYYVGMFSTPEAAFAAYKVAKECCIKSMADKYRSVIDPRCYEALYNYKVEITD